MGNLWSLALTYSPALWQRRWIAIAVAWVVCLIGWPAIAFVPSHYVSTSQIYVDTHSLLEPLLSGIAVDIDPTQQVDILKETLTSESNLERVERVTNPSATVLSPSALSSAAMEIKNNVKIDSTEDNVFTISYDSLSPTQSQQIVQAFLNLFLESNFGVIRQDLDSAQSFLHDQVDQAERTMRDTDNALAHFKESNADTLSVGGSYSEALQKAETDVQDLTAQVQDLQAKASAYRSELGTVPRYGVTQKGDVTPVSPLDQRIREAEDHLDQLRAQYTEQHPEVIAAEKSLADLKAQAANERATGSLDPDAQVSDLYQQLDLQLVDVQAQIAAAQTQLTRRSAALENLKNSAARIPALESQLNHLQSDADLAHSQYQSLAARLQSANLSQNRESEVSRIQFRIIDPPQVPRTPSGLKRSLLLSVILLAGLGFGLAVILAIVLTQNTFVDATRLAKVIDYPVLGSISRAEAPQEVRIHVIKSGLFGGAVLGLFIVFGTLMLIERNIGVSALVPSWLHSAPSGSGGSA